MPAISPKLGEFLVKATRSKDIDDAFRRVFSDYLELKIESFVETIESLELYTTMLRIRLCEESCVEPILNGEMRCPVHLYSGEEAIAVGVCAALCEEDYVFGTHRSHGHCLAKVGEMNQVVAEIYGKETGCSKGRGGSMHIIEPATGMVGLEEDLLVKSKMER